MELESMNDITKWESTAKPGSRQSPPSATTLALLDSIKAYGQRKFQEGIELGRRLEREGK